MTDPEFIVRAHYWPARAGVYWWEYFEADEVRRDFEAAALSAVHHLDIDLVWPEFEPEAGRVSAPAMRRMEIVLDAAADAGLLLKPALFPALPAGVRSLPPWTTDRFALLEGEPTALDVWREPGLVRAEEVLVREVIGEFAAHPAVDGWVLGSRLERVRRPGAWPAMEEWLDQMASAARQAGSRQPLWSSISARTVIGAPLRFDVARELGLRWEVAVDWEPPWAGGPPAAWASFLAGYLAALSGVAVAAGNLGPSTAAPGSLLPGCLDEARAAAQVEATLHAVRDAGGAGASAAALLDYDPALQRFPPFHQHPAALTRGLLRLDRTPKESAIPWYELDRVPEGILPGDFPTVEVERHAQSPEAVARSAYDEYVAST